MPGHNSTNRLLFVPIVGIIVFIILYFIAALLYPGGSETDKSAIGYSLGNNYWCNLLYKNAINGEPNKGLYFAIAAMIILCLSLSVFWFAFPVQAGLKKSHRLLIQVPGVAAMVSSFFLLTELNHDLIVNTSSLLGLIATMGTMVALYKIKWYPLFVFGIFNVLLVVLNNYLYHTKGMMVYLPIVQKISFVSFLVWICFMCAGFQSVRYFVKKIAPWRGGKF